MSVVRWIHATRDRKPLGIARANLCSYVTRQRIILVQLIGHALSPDEPVVHLCKHIGCRRLFLQIGGACCNQRRNEKQQDDACEPKEVLHSAELRISAATDAGSP